MASKRNLAILLVMPFVVALLSFGALKATFNLIESDIVAIDWEYDDNEMFVLSNDSHKHLLKATALNDENYPAVSDLDWSVENVNLSEEPHAEIIEENGSAYLKTLSTGEVIVSVRNKRGNIQKSMRVTIFENSVIIFNSLVKSSQSNIDKDVYYGQFDLDGNSKVLSSISFELKAVFEGTDTEAEIKASSSNLTYNNETRTITFKDNLVDKVEDAYIELGYKNILSSDSYRYDFKIVKDGVNVYNYEDLLKCTNKSESGEIVVLRKNLVSEDNLKIMDPNSSSLFGTSKANFKNEIYKFETRFNRNYIDQWNAFAASSGGQYSPISSTVNVGIHVQKDFYGNGFTINMHDLTYPYDKRQELDSQTGEYQIVPQLSNLNLFRGPLTYYSLGDPNNSPLAKAYGQDNIGMYVEGDNITINDVRLKNCDFGNNLYNLNYTGTTMEVYGDNVTIKNSVLSRGKNVLKVYDSNNVLLDNSLLEYSRNFLLSTGSYDYLPVDDSTVKSFVNQDGSASDDTLANYLAPNQNGDQALTSYTIGSTIDNNLLSSIRSIQSGLDNSSVTNQYHGDLTVKDSLFYQSGITSIALESMFNGSFLYNASPNKVVSVLSNHSSEFEEQSLGIPFFPTGVGGTSYPVKLTLKGKTQFYDYKTQNLLDLGGFVEENMNKVSSIFSTSETLTLDKIFPIKQLLMDSTEALNVIYENQMNIPITYYGGGLNLSTVIYDNFVDQDHLLDNVVVDVVSRYATGAISNDMLVRILTKCVTLVSGFNPFKFVFAKGDGYLFNETPKVQTLIDNNK